MPVDDNNNNNNNDNDNLGGTAEDIQEAEKARLLEEIDKEEVLIDAIGKDVAAVDMFVFNEYLNKGKAAMTLPQVAKILAVGVYTFCDEIIKKCEVEPLLVNHVTQHQEQSQKISEEETIQLIENHRLDLINMVSDMIRHFITYQEGDYKVGSHMQDKDVLEFNKKKEEMKKKKSRKKQKMMKMKQKKKKGGIKLTD